MKNEKRGRPEEERTGTGGRVYALRRQLALTMDEAAQRWGVSRTQLNAYEMEKSNLPLAVLCRIADKEKVSTDWILCRTDEWRMA